MEALDDLGTEAHVALLRDQALGHGIVVPFDCHVVVDVDADQFPHGILLGLGGERSEGGTLQGLDEALAGARQLLAGPLVQGAPRRSAMAVCSSRSEQNVCWRRRASIHRSTTCTPTSTLALSRGRTARAGTMATP